VSVAADRWHGPPKGPRRVVLALAVTLSLMPSLAGPASAETANPVTTPDSTVANVIVVRHAERDTVLIGPDHPLTEAGVLRAQELAHTLGSSGISAIYVTPWQRSRNTAQPLATAIGESLTVVNDVAETVRRLRTGHFGETVLVVGHSNTVPDIVTALTGRPFPTPGRVPYDGMWVVTLWRDGRASLLVLRYGAPAR
jgi:broad specificity phosphatase PhoE